LWFELGENIALYEKELAKVKPNPRSYLIIPTRIPFNSQKVNYREKLVEGISKNLAGECTYSNYQISNWFSFTWRYKLKIKFDNGTQRLCFLYGDNIQRKLLFGDVPSESITVVEEVFMDEIFNLPAHQIETDNFVDVLADALMEPIAARTVTIDHLHRYTDNRIRFDLIFDDVRYHFICTRRELKKGLYLPELTIFFED
jgi:hypothetical protein